MLYRKPYMQYLIEGLEIQLNEIFYEKMLTLKRECNNIKFVLRIKCDC